jgi:hypothetical protein
MPIRLTLKQAAIPGHYVWRTQRDARARATHRANDGHIFSWANPPATGNPGEDYGCRCEAVPYVPGETEFAFHEFTTSLASSYDRWADIDFIGHYYFGDGRAVDLLEIGHLREIAEQYAYMDDVEGAFRRLSDQIVDKARKNGAGFLGYPFNDTYDFRPVQFSHGDGTVSGQFIGVVERYGVMLRISGESNFYFHDIFADPIDMDIEPGGVPYHITGSWSASFEAEVLENRTRSDFFARAR